MNYNYLEKYKKYKKKYFHAKEIERYIDAEGGQKPCDSFNVKNGTMGPIQLTTSKDRREKCNKLPHCKAVQNKNSTAFICKKKEEKKKKEKSIYQVERERKAKAKEDAKIKIAAPKKYEQKLPEEVVKSLKLSKDSVDNTELQSINRILDAQKPKMIEGHCKNCGKKFSFKSRFCKMCKRIAISSDDPMEKLAKGVKIDWDGKLRRDLVDKISLTDPDDASQNHMRWNTFYPLAYLAGSDIKIDDKKRNHPAFLSTINVGWSINSPHKLKKKMYGKMIVGHIFNVPGKFVKDPADVSGLQKLSRIEIKALVAHKICCVYFIEMLININAVMKMGIGAKLGKEVQIKRTNFKQYYRIIYYIIHAIKEVDITPKELRKWYDYCTDKDIEKRKKDAKFAGKPMNKGAIEFERSRWEKRWKNLHNEGKLSLFKQFVELKIIAFNFYYQYGMDDKIKDKGEYIVNIKSELKKIRDRSAYSIENLIKNNELIHFRGPKGNEEVIYEKIEHFATAGVKSRYNLLSPARWARNCESMGTT